MHVVVVLATLVGSPTGGVFDGPTHASACSVYWAPAALGTEESPQAFYAEGIGSYIHPSYRRVSEDPNGPSYPEVNFTSVTPDGCVAYVTEVPSRTLRLFAGVFSPSAGGAQWPKDGPQRYQGTYGLFLTYGLLTGLVWQPASWLWVSAGGGPLYERIRLDYAYDFGTFINSRLPSGSDLFALEDPALEGNIKLSLDGWTVMGSLSAYAKPTKNLDIALGFFIAKNGHLSGTADVQGPAALRTALPDLVVNPRGKLVLSYPLPWFVNLETQVTLGKWVVAPLVQFQRRSRQRALVAKITESQSNFIEGDQVSLREVRDEVMIGLRVQRVMTDKLTVGARFDLTPRNTPKEAITATNIDFTLLEGDVGLRYAFSQNVWFEATYAVIGAIPVDVTRSVFNPRADPNSGLSQGSPLGRYSAWGQKAAISMAFRFGR